MLAMFGAGVQAQTGEMVVLSQQGETVTVNITEDHYKAGIWYSKDGSRHPLNLYVATGQIAFDESGEPQSTEDGEVVFSMPVYDIKNISFSGLSESGIIQTTTTDIRVSVESGILTVSRVASPLLLSIADVEGRILLNRTLTADATIDLKSYGNGILIVSSGSQTFKIMVK